VIQQGHARQDRGSASHEVWGVNAVVDGVHLDAERREEPVLRRRLRPGSADPCTAHDVDVAAAGYEVRKGCQFGPAQIMVAKQESGMGRKVAVVNAKPVPVV
jgi:hypothetical protein